MKRNVVILCALVAITLSFVGCEAEVPSEAFAPVIVSTAPIHVATDIDVVATVTAVFSEAMNPTTINGTTFTVSKGIVAVEGTVTYDLPTKKAIFTPSAKLAYSQKYSVKLTTGMKSSENVAMENTKEWSFTTADESVLTGVGPSPVLLRTAGNYVILAKSAISTVPASVITGNVGLSPAALSFMTGFSHTLATGYATTPQVTGFLYAADMVTPTSSNLTTAVENMLTAYDDAAGRITPDKLNLKSGGIGGEILAPGLYKWTSSVSINSDVTISGGAKDTWIFQIDGDLALADTKKVILSGGALAKNIVWQVKGKVEMGVTSHFEGIVLCQTQITLKTGATMNGRLLAQTLIALDQATVTKPVL